MGTTADHTDEARHDAYICGVREFIDDTADTADILLALTACDDTDKKFLIESLPDLCPSIWEMFEAQYKRSDAHTR